MYSREFGDDNRLARELSAALVKAGTSAADIQDKDIIKIKNK